MMKKNLLILISLFVVTGLFAQEFNVPQNYKLEKAPDFAKYEKDVINCFNWLMVTPVAQQAEKRKEANVFLLKWISGSPDISIEIKPGIVTFMENPDLLMVFMGAWTKYSLETKNFKDKYNGNLKGIESVIEFYQANKSSLHKDKNVEKYIKMKEKGTLEEYVKNNA